MALAPVADPAFSRKVDGHATGRDPGATISGARNGRGASAPPGPSSSSALHRHSVGALTSGTAFPVTAPAFAFACGCRISPGRSPLVVELSNDLGAADVDMA